MRDSMIFYRSFYEAIKELPLETQGEIYNAIFTYGLDFEVTELSGVSKTIWTLIKPQIDANIKRFENGKKPKNKQTESKTESKTEAKNNQEESKTETNNNNNNNVNDNDNVNEKEIKFDFKKSLLSFGFDSILVDEWLKVRRVKKAVNSEIAFNGFIREVNLNGQDINFILQKCVEKGWRSFESDWLPKQNNNTSVTITLDDKLQSLGIKRK